MSFQTRLSLLEPAETWPSLHSSAQERFWDGIELATTPDARRTAAIYMLGYVVEILLKVAFFRVRGLPAEQPIDLRVIATRATWMKSNLHNLAGLADLLIAERGFQHRPFDPVFAGQLKTSVLTVASHWRETLRYRHSPATESELVEVYQNVDWLQANAALLWS